MSRAIVAILIVLFCVSVARAQTSVPGYSLRELRFSPDGAYILAQDSLEITVLTVRPLSVVFRIPAGEASNAQFTPDSLQVVFVTSASVTYTPGPTAGTERTLHTRSGPHRVERWTISNRTHFNSSAIPGRGCGTEELSPDGGILACDDPVGTLRIIDVASSEVLFEKTEFVRLIPLYSHTSHGYIDIPSGHFLGELSQAIFDFSPDGRFLMATPSGGAGKDLVYDLRQRSASVLPSRMRNPYGWSTFLAPHQLLIADATYHAKRGVVSAKMVAFPSLMISARFKVPAGRLSRAADPGWVLVRPFGKRSWWHTDAGRAAAAQLSTDQVIISNSRALDVFGRYYLAEPSPGWVGLYERGKGLQT